MKCPACERTLVEMRAGDVTVDVCRGGCAGIWFDNHELKRFDEPHEAVGEPLLEVGKDSSVNIDHESRRACPKCSDQKMLRHFFSVRRQVEIDECPACGGVWLDYGELATIRTQFQSEAERDEATDAYFGELFGDKLAEMRAESEEKYMQARRFARIFRWICPSYWIPGKQDWGAF